MQVVFQAKRRVRARSPVSAEIPVDSPDPCLAHRLIDVSIILAVVAAPLYLGGRHPVGQLLLALSVLPGCAGILWLGFKNELVAIPKRLSILAISALAVPMVQMSPLGTSLVELLSPQTRELLPLWASGLHKISLAPTETRLAFAVLAAHVVIFLMVWLRTRTMLDVQRAFLIVGGSALLLALVATLQARWGNGRFMWFYIHPFRDPGDIPRGPFQNENHLAQVLALGIGPILYFLFLERAPASRKPTPGSLGGLLYRRHHLRGIQRWAAAAASVFILAVAFATNSRGGIAVLVLAILIFTVALLAHHAGLRDYLAKRKAQTALLAGTLSVVTVGCAVVLLARNLESWSYWRARLWAADFRIWQQFPLLGTGVGSHRYVYMGFLDESFSQDFAHAESSWIQLLVETGLVGVGIALVIVAVVGSQLIRAYFGARCFSSAVASIALLASVGTSVVHAVADFVWHIPTCATFAVVLAAVAYRLPSLGTGGTGASAEPTDNSSGGVQPANLELRKITPWVGAAGLAFWAALALWQPATASYAWDDCLRLSDSEALETEGDQLLPRKMQLLDEVLRRDPNHTRARTKLAQCYLSYLTQHPQLAEPQRRRLAGAALSCSKAAMQSCPAAGKAYFYAAMSMQMLGGHLAQQTALLDQASKLRLADPQLALARARIQWLQGDVASATDLWRHAIRCDPQDRAGTIDAMTENLQVQLLLSILQPDRITTGRIYHRMRERQRTAEMKIAGQRYVELLMEDGTNTTDPLLAGSLYSSAHGVAVEIGDLHASQKAAAAAVDRNPNNWKYRKLLATAAYRCEDYATAVEHLAWCSRIRPRDEDVKQLAIKAVKLGRAHRRHPLVERR